MKINLKNNEKISRNSLTDLELINENERRVPFVLVSKDNARKIFDYWSGEYVNEILDINGADVTSLNAVYYNHETNSLPIAKLENIRNDNGSLKADVVFDKDDEFSEKIFRKIEKGFLKYCSVGYIPDGDNLEVIREENKTTQVILRKFRIVELSITGTPADAGAKIGRNQDASDVINKTNETYENKTEKRGIEMNVEIKNDGERERVLQVLELGRIHGFERNSESFIRDGKSVDDFKSFILDELSKRSSGAKNIQETNASFNSGLSEKEKKKYSVRNAILAQLEPMKRNCFEKEVSDSLEKELGRQARGILIPTDIPLMKRAVGMNTLEMAHGGSFVPTDFKGDNFIDLLNNKMISGQLGIQQLTGLKGNIVIPRLEDGAKASWVKEGEDIKGSKEKTGALELKMKTVANHVDVTRSMLINSDPSMDGLIINDISGAIARALDHAIFMGEGGDAPLGIVNTRLVSVTEYTNGISWDDVVDLESAVSDKNADISTLYYISSAVMRGYLKKTPKVQGFPEYIMSGETLNGYSHKATNQIDRDLLIYGDFSQVIQGLWGGLDILVDPYSQAQSAITRLFAYQSADVGIRYPQSFAFLKKKKGAR